MRLARQISHQVTNSDGYIPILAMSPTWEQSFVEALVGDGEERTLTMPPSRIQEFITIRAPENSMTLPCKARVAVFC